MNEVCLLFLLQIIHLSFVTLTQLALELLSVFFQLLNSTHVPSNLLVFFIDQTLYGTRSLQKLLIVLSDLSLKLLLLHLKILDDPVLLNQYQVDIGYIALLEVNI